MDNKKKNPNVPNLRFSNTQQNWEIYKVSDLLSCVSTNSLTWNELSYDEESSLKNIHYGLIHNGFTTTCISCDNKLIPYVNIHNFPKQYSCVEKGDIILADASEDRKDVGRAIEIININDKIVISGLHTIHAKNKLDLLEIGYKGFYFNSNVMKKQIHRIANGSKIYSISPSNFNELYISIPNKHEQTRIVSLLSLIEQRIETQNKIINNLESQKNYIINKLIDNKNSIFCISELMHIGRGRVISNNELDKIEDGKYPVYSSQTSNNGIMGYLNTFDFDGEYITWTTDGANAGTVYYRNGKFNCTNVCGTLKSKNDNVDLFYVAQILPLFTKKYVSINLANPKLMNNVMGNIKIPLPSIDIQKQHSNIIKKLTDKLETETQILNNLKLQKNYLLNNLFI